jgi:enoyl-CoA hydratase/carnithine racemase
MLSVKTELDSQGVMTFWLDSPNKRVNTLSRQMWADLGEAIEQVKRDEPKCVTIKSAKPGSFVVGADLYEIREMTDDQFDNYILTGQQILTKLSKLWPPTIAIINGDCIGGGLELTLACTVRLAIAEPDPGTGKVGLPELRLGLIPGWGGTVRLPRLIGNGAIEFILQSELLNPEQAKKKTIVDNLVSESDAETLPAKLAADLINKPLPARRTEFSYDDGFEKSLNEAKSKAITPASKQLLETIQVGMTQGESAGLDSERTGITQLRRTPECQAALQKFYDRKKGNQGM